MVNSVSAVHFLSTYGLAGLSSTCFRDSEHSVSEAWVQRVALA